MAFALHVILHDPGTASTRVACRRFRRPALAPCISATACTNLDFALRHPTARKRTLTIENSQISALSHLLNAGTQDHPRRPYITAGRPKQDEVKGSGLQC